jgi:hypothetical protein
MIVNARAVPRTMNNISIINKSGIHLKMGVCKGMWKDWEERLMQGRVY